MAQLSPPGAQMYEAEWQLDGESIVRLYIHATNEAEVLAEAEGFFARFPSLDFRRGHANTTVNVRLLRLGETTATNDVQKR